MSIKAKSQPAKAGTRISKEEIDNQVNAAFTAYTSCLGRPFKTGAREIRSIVREWCPLLYLDTVVPIDDRAFYEQYGPAHFFDRYFYATELEVTKALENSAWEKFQLNLLRGALHNEEIMLGQNAELEEIFRRAYHINQHILGSFDEEEVFALCSHGPNATRSVRSIDSYLDIKSLDFSGSAPVLETFFMEYLQYDELLLRCYLKYSDEVEPLTIPAPNGTNRMSFVPKKFDKLRSISVEPTLNMFFQLGTGKLLQKRLSEHTHIDLTYQQQVHKKLTALASRYPEVDYATLDWSEASDRIWLSICEKIIPGDWLWWLKHIRSTGTEHNGESYDLPMIGTMGNGFTFPLQTLVFYSILCAIAEMQGIQQWINVFGDDCIVPSMLVPHVKRFATYVGWSLNSEKSFSEGPFRESCGMDSYRGSNVRPFQIERPACSSSKTSMKAWVYTVYNNIVTSLQGRYPTFHIARWVCDMHATLNLGAIYFVPTRFSEASGIRLSEYQLKCLIHDRLDRDIEPFIWHAAMLGPQSISIPKETDSGTVTFRFLQNVPAQRSVIWEEPYLWLSLRSQTESRPYKFVWYEDMVLPSLKDGKVPVKMNSYASRTGVVHTWQYWLN